MAKPTKQEPKQEAVVEAVVEKVLCVHNEETDKCAECARRCECGHALGDHLWTKTTADRGPCGDCDCPRFREAL